MDEINQTVEILNKGGIIIFPTDTAFGIGCRMDNEEAIKRLFEIRKRPVNMAVPVLVSSIEMAKEYLEEVPEDVQSLMKKYWPGALTIVHQCKMNRVPSLVRGGGDTLGVRVPNNELIRNVIEKVGIPILGPSANFSGEKTPYKFEELNPELVSLSDYVIKGSTLQKVEPSTSVSTVIDASIKPWKILREGAIKLNL